MTGWVYDRAEQRPRRGPDPAFGCRRRFDRYQQMSRAAIRRAVFCASRSGPSVPGESRRWRTRWLGGEGAHMSRQRIYGIAAGARRSARETILAVLTYADSGALKTLRQSATSLRPVRDAGCDRFATGLARIPDR